MADIELVIKIPEGIMEYVKNNGCVSVYDEEVTKAIINGTPLPEIYGRLGDLDELEQRISNFIEHDAHMLDEYTLIRERFILDGIKDTHTIIEANNAESDKDLEQEEPER